MSLSKSKCWYSNNCLHFLKCAVPLYHSGRTIDIESLQNRLLMVCYVPATSAGLPSLNFFFYFFVAAAINSTNEANKAGGMLSSLYS